MESRFFQGMIGGKPDKALYFLGRKNENYIYLDPHLVQVGVNKNNLNENRSTYFCNSFRMCKNTSIDPSIGIGYFLSDLKDID
jgi:cysteine protease ATG4